MVMRTAGRAIAGVLATVFTVCGAGAGIVIYLLASGPISLNFLTPHVKAALEAIDSRVDFDVDDTVLAWQGRDRRLDLRLVGVRIRDTGGQEIARIPQMAIGLDTKALFRGEFAAKSIDMFGPAIRLMRGKSGDLKIGVGLGDDGDGGSDGGGALLALIRDRDGGGAAGMASTLQSISIYQAEISYEDEILPLKISAPDTILKLQRQGQTVAIRLRSRLEVDGIAADVEINLSYLGPGSALPLTIGFSGLDVARFLARFTKLDKEWAALTELTAAGTLHANISPLGALKGVEFDISTGAGSLRIGEILAAPLKVNRAHIKGQLAGSLDRAEFERMQVALPSGLNLTASGLIERKADGFAVNLSGALDKFSTADLVKYWPDKLAEDGRTWVASHLSGGRIFDATWRLAITPETFKGKEPPKDYFKLNFKYQGIKVDYLPPMLPIEAVSGSGELLANSFSMRIGSGVAKDLKLSKGRLRIASFAARTPRLDISFQVDGPVATALSLINSKPLKFADNIQIDPKTSSGHGKSQVSLKIPLKHKLRGVDIDFAFTSSIKNAASPSIFDFLALRKANLVLKASGKEITVDGQAEINTIPAKFALRHVFSTRKTTFSDRIVVRTAMTGALQKQLKLDLAPYVVGTIPLDLTVKRQGDTPFLLSGKVDLRDSAIHIPALPWRKPKAAAATVSFQTELRPGNGIVVDRFDFKAKGLTLGGRLELDDKSAFKRLKASVVKFGGSNLTADLSISEDRRWIVKLGGRVLDLRRNINELEEKGESGVDLPELDLSVQVGRALLTDDVHVQKAIIAASWRNGRLQALKAWGRVNGGPPVRADLISQGKRRTLEISTRAGGEVLQALDLFHNAYGGVLHLVADIPETPTEKNPIKGQIKVSNFIIARAPTLGDILNRGKLTDLVDELSGEGVKFTGMDVPFTYGDARLVVDELRAVGPRFGFTLRGVVNRETDALDLQGTVIPSYTMNSILGKIPIFGWILTGGGGVFAITYRVKGTIDKPQASVSTLSKFAPGFLRAVIEGLDAPVMGKNDEALLNEPKLERFFR